MALSNEPSAKQIVDLSGDNKIAANEDVLRDILLNPDVKDKPVCVVSITGTFRQGKSFLLNFFVRYLKLKYKLKKITSEKWLDARDGNISGFSWKCGSSRHTVGILIWSEIFIAELPSGKEIAIVLLDSQGTFDTKTTKQHCAAVFAISTLISSVQIFNLKEKINQFDLEHLECFSGYGQLALEESSRFNGSPFQNLWFLIRDWPYQFEFDFGSSSGNLLLQSVINSTELTPELKAQKENIFKLFENIRCCLLPHPEIAEKFLKHVEEFVPSVLSPENLVTKTINGQIIKVSDLYTFIQIYCDYFSNGNVPPLTTMYMAAAEAQLKIAVSEAEAMYKETMDNIVDVDTSLGNDVLEEYHLEEKQKVLEYLDNKKVMGNEETKKKFKKMLKRKLDERFVAYRRINRIKQEKERELACQQNVFENELREEGEKLQKLYDDEMQHKLEDLRSEQAKLETRLLEEKNKHIVEKNQLEMQNLRDKQAHKEELVEKDKQLDAEKQRRVEDNLAHQKQLFEEKLERKTMEIEAAQDSRLHEMEMKYMHEKTECLETEKNNLLDDKEKLIETLEKVTEMAEDAKREAQEAREKAENISGCIIV